MPSREKIAGWLREAGFAFIAVNCKPLQDQFNDRAAQVENMRCETCDRYVTGDDDESCTFNQIEYQGKGFGCFFHKPKEVTK